MRKDHERDSYRPIRSGRNWQSANARTYSDNDYSSDRGFDQDYEHNETQHFDRGYPSEHDREMTRHDSARHDSARQYSDSDNGRIASGRPMDMDRSNGFDDSYRHRDTDRTSFRSNNTRPYNFSRSNSEQSLSGQTWAGSDRSDRMSFDAGREARGEATSQSRYGRDYYDTSYGTGYGSSYGSTGSSESSFGAGADYNRSMDRASENRMTNTHFGKGPKGWKRSDERIKEEVSEALYRAHEVDASDIDVMVQDGTVTLKGTVESRDAKRAAEMCVERLSGVSDVTNELKVSKSSEGLIGKGQTYVQGKDSNASSSSSTANGAAKSSKLS